MIAGFAFTALVELTISVDMVDKLRASGYIYLEFIYYLSIGSTIALNLFVIVISVRLTGLEPQPSRLKIDLPLTLASPALDRRWSTSRGSAWRSSAASTRP